MIEVLFLTTQVLI